MEFIEKWLAVIGLNFGEEGIAMAILLIILVPLFIFMLFSLGVLFLTHLHYLEKEN